MNNYFSNMLWNPYLELLLLRLCFSLLEFRLSFPFFSCLIFSFYLEHCKYIYFNYVSCTLTICIPWAFILIVCCFSYIFMLFYSLYASLVLSDNHPWDMKTKCRNNFKPSDDVLPSEKFICFCQVAKASQIMEL